MIIYQIQAKVHKDYQIQQQNMEYRMKLDVVKVMKIS